MVIVSVLAVILGISFAIITYLFVPNPSTFIFVIVVAISPLLVYLLVRYNVLKIKLNLKERLFIYFIITSLLPSIPIMFIAHHILKVSIEKFTNNVVLEPIELSIEGIKRYEEVLSSEIDEFIKNKDKLECGEFGKIVIFSITDGEKAICHINSLHIAKDYVVYNNRFYKTKIYPKEKYDIEVGHLVFMNIDRWKEKLANAVVFLKSERWRGKNFKVVLNIFFIIFALFIFIFSIFFAIAVSSNILMPINELKEAIRELAKGNWNKKLKSVPVEELRDLVFAFNEMVDELNRYKETIRRTEKLVAWREVAQRVAHEIKNPLTPIQLSAERIKKRFYQDPSNLEKVIKDSVNTIMDSVNILKSIVNEFSEFARLPSAKLIKGNLNLVIEEVLRGYPSNDKVIFKAKLEQSLPKIYIDPSQIKRLLINLIQNSISAIKEKGEVVITTRYDVVNRKVILSIKDTGEGIPDEVKDRIFEPYFTTKKYGTGLGLAIVEHIVKEHFAKIYFESEKDKGTTFYIEFEVREDV